MTKIQNNWFWSCLVFGYWNLFVIWCLYFVIFSSSGSSIRRRKIQVFDEKILKAYLFRQGQVFDT